MRFFRRLFAVRQQPAPAPLLPPRRSTILGELSPVTDTAYEAETMPPLEIWIDHPDNTEATIAFAERFWTDLEEWDRKCRDYARGPVLELKNESWLSKYNETVDAEKFDRTMELFSVAITGPEEFSVVYDDGGLFAGHGIEISGTLAEGPDRFDLVG